MKNNKIFYLVIILIIAIFLVLLLGLKEEKNYTPQSELKKLNDSISLKELYSEKNIHIDDGVAITKFLYWIKYKNKKKITEIGAEKKLEKFRKKNSKSKKKVPSKNFSELSTNDSQLVQVHEPETANDESQIKAAISSYLSSVQKKLGTDFVSTLKLN